MSAGGAKGWLLYDGACSLCVAFVRRFEPLLARYQFKTLPLQSAWARERLGIGPETRWNEMAFLASDGRAFGGVDGLLQILRQVWWGKPLFALAQIPGVKPMLRAGYRFVATRRYCFNGACSAQPGSKSLWDWLPLVGLLMAALTARNSLPAWGFMCLLASAFFFGCKWLTWRRAMRVLHGISAITSFGYFFAWVGMDARKFLPRQSIPRPAVSDWLFAGGKTLHGIGFVALLLFAEEIPVVRWYFAVGAILLTVHFGLFHLLALAWRRAGHDAELLMRGPFLATSLAGFWGQRWNTAFHLLAYDLVFRPWVKFWGVTGAMLAVFLISGVIHDLVISLPANAGYGLPTAYFAFQGLAVLFERTAAGRRLGLGRGAIGSLFTMLCVIGPAYWLFHPAFIDRVVFPMLETLMGKTLI